MPGLTNEQFSRFVDKVALLVGDKVDPYEGRPLSDLVEPLRDVCSHSGDFTDDERAMLAVGMLAQGRSTDEQLLVVTRAEFNQNDFKEAFGVEEKEEYNRDIGVDKLEKEYGLEDMAVDDEAFPALMERADGYRHILRGEESPGPG